MLMEMTVRDFLQELASDLPAPGGGSVSALAGALSAALVSMVAQLTPDQQPAQKDILGKAADLMAVLERDVDADTEAFNKVMDAYRLPKQTAAEKEKRSQVIQQALQGAALHPMKVARECLDVLRLCSWAAAEGNPNALSDAGVAALLAQSGVRGALYNVEINLSSIKDQQFKEGLTGEKEEILKESAQLQQEMDNILNNKLA
ncbi:MAG TPA: methenyltetrahydrofolate cyclohydrolase [Peptococcaceae bacterium]|nr:methenyltetrahydrofolate cyclohydrolase [Peptococcaceae bacterium]